MIFDLTPPSAEAHERGTREVDAQEASVGFAVELVEGTFPFRATAQYCEGPVGRFSVVVTVVDDSTPQDMASVAAALLQT